MPGLTIFTQDILISVQACTKILCANCYTATCIQVSLNVTQVYSLIDIYIYICTYVHTERWGLLLFKSNYIVTNTYYFT